MLNAPSLFLFLLFGLVLVGMYVAIRRRWLSVTLIAALGVLASVIIMTLVAAAQGNTIYQAVFVGFMIGGLFSVGTLVMALYFLRSESRRIR